MADGAPGEGRGWRTWLPGPVDLLCLLLAGWLLHGHRLLGLDTWWHLSQGVETLETGRIPRVDSLSWSAQGELTTHSWLFDLVLGALQRLGGLGMVELGGALAVALVLRLVAHAARALGASGWAALLAPLALFHSVPQFLDLRPQLFSYAGLAALLAAYAALREGRPGPLRWSPLLLLVWSNFHGGFVLGLVFLLGLAGMERALARAGDEAARARARALVGALLLGILASCVHPRGPLQFLHALENTPLSTPLNATVDEWQPPHLGRVPALRWWVLAAVGLALAHPGRPPLFEALGVLAGLGAALGAMRNLPLLAVAGGPILGVWATRVARVATPWLAAHRPGALAGLARLEGLAARGSLRGGCALLLAAALARGALERGSPGDVEAAPWVAGRYPVGAARWVLAHPLQGRLLNSYAMGGYLGWALRGRHKVAIDSRMTPFHAFYQGDYALIWTGAREWREGLARTGAEFAILERGATPLPLLRGEPTWQAVYADPVAVVLVRAAGPNGALPALPAGSW